MNTPKIFILCGPGGGGKETVLNAITEKTGIVRARTVTTRDRRQGESENGGRVFVSVEKFNELFESGELIEKNFFWGNWYGSKKSDIEDEINQGCDVIVELDLNGARTFKKMYDNVVAIFLKVDLDDLERRLIDRGRDTKEQIEKRMEISREELRNCNICNYIVENKYGEIDQTVQKVLEIINKDGAKGNISG